MSSDEKTTSFQSSVLAELSWRGLIKQVTHDELDEKLSEEDLTLYCGFDPSADSLHAGNLVSIMGLAHFRRHGHHPIALVGGATGMIGDPSGKSNERDLLDDEILQKNLAGISKQLRTILDRSTEMHAEGLDASEREIPIVNNADWIRPWSFIDFLRDVGKHFKVNHMINKTSVKERLENRDQGISYTEFSYMLIQGYDFFHLFKEHGCTLQIGGSDQWGNITAGTDLIRSKERTSAFGATFNLLTDKNGKKYGKSEAGAIWLDAERTSPYQFFQYWLGVDDEEVGKLLRTFTFLSQEKIEELEADPYNGKKVFAYEITALVHGKDAADKVVRASKVLFGGEMDQLTDADLKDAFAEVPTTEVSRQRLEEGIEVLDLFVEVGLEKSKGAARRKLEQGGLYLNNNRIEDREQVIGLQDLATETAIFLRSGKRNKHLLRMV